MGELKRFEIEQREEWGVINETGGSRQVNDYNSEKQARAIVRRYGGELMHRTVYVWTGEWKPVPENKGAYGDRFDEPDQHGEWSHPDGE